MAWIPLTAKRNVPGEANAIDIQAVANALMDILAKLVNAWIVRGNVAGMVSATLWQLYRIFIISVIQRTMSMVYGMPTR